MHLTPPFLVMLLLKLPPVLSPMKIQNQLPDKMEEMEFYFPSNTLDFSLLLPFVLVLDLSFPPIRFVLCPALLFFPVLHESDLSFLFDVIEFFLFLHNNVLECSF